MAHQPSNQSVLTLRAIVTRISSTPTKQLPHLARNISGSFWNCKDLLSGPQQTAKSSTESSTLLHRFRTSLTSLLQDRTVEGRWAGVVLVKATIEAGGIEILSKSNAWIRSLLTILKKPDPPTTRTLAAITLTRIFILTWDYQNLVREITTPNLPAFISVCLSNVENSKKRSSSEIESILEAFVLLLPRHPTLFRNHESSIRSLLFKILSTSTGEATSDAHYSQKETMLAQRLLALLHHCAPKQGAGEKWRETIISTLSAAHTVCDVIFRSVIENKALNVGIRPDSSASLSTGHLGNDSQDHLGLAPWTGLFEGASRLMTLLDVLGRHFDTASAGMVAVPLGQVVELLIRLLSITLPGSNNTISMTPNNQIPKDERDSMYALLPEIHTSALNLVGTMLDRFSSSVVSLVQPLLERIADVFESEIAFVSTRTATYETVCKLLELVGASMSKADVAELTSIPKACCEDLLSQGSKIAPANTTAVNGARPKEHSQATDATLSAISINLSHPTQLEDLQRAAKALLVVLLTKIDSGHMPRKIRVQMERSAIFLKDREALVACVLNPAKNASGTAAQTSLLPLLARLFPESSEAEALLRPRMPVISPTVRHNAVDEEELQDEEKSVVNGGSAIIDEGLAGEVDSGNGAGHSLLDASERSESSRDHVEKDLDDLYTASPRLLPQSEDISPQLNQVVDTLADPASAPKRPAVESLDDQLSAKRLRAASLAETLVSHETQANSSTDTVVNMSQTQAKSQPLIASISGPPTEAGANPEVVPDYAVSSHVSPLRDSNDDSDIEVPPLTMESDSEPEEDEDG